MAGMSSPELESAYLRCQAYTRQRAKNFYYGFTPLSRPQRLAMYAAYAFSGECDDLVDEGGDIAQKKGAIDEYRGVLARTYAGRPETPTTVALHDAAKRYSIPREYFDELLNGMEMDLERARYQSFEELRQYCYRVASTIGLICIQVFGYRDAEARDYAADMGIALQLTNIMRDLREDAERGRIYLPQDELERYGYSERELRLNVVNKQFLDLMGFQAERARYHFQRGQKLLPLLPPRGRMCANGLQGVYFDILRMIEQRDYDVFRERVSRSKPGRLALLGKLWVSSLTIRDGRTGSP
jgi:phytoene synthase